MGEGEIEEVEGKVLCVASDQMCSSAEESVSHRQDMVLMAGR